MIYQKPDIANGEGSPAESVGSSPTEPTCSTASAEKIAIELCDVHFAWPGKSEPILRLQKLKVVVGESLFIQGPSGCGKSTLLNLIAGVITPQMGQVSVLGKPFGSLSGPARDRYRADHMGIIFQMFNLVPYLTVLENVTLPCLFSKIRRQMAVAAGGLHREAERLLSSLGISDQGVIHKPVTELSVGQQQRVAAARAFIGSPEIIIADEPTSSLDSEHRESFIRLLFNECRQAGITLVFVSHDTSLSRSFDRNLELQEINLAKGTPRTTSTMAA